jgi:hypothetical protein
MPLEEGLCLYEAGRHSDFASSKRVEFLTRAADLFRDCAAVDWER